MITLIIDALLREMHIMESNVFEFEKEPLLTLNDPKSFGYLKLRDFSYRDQIRGRTNGTWTVDARDI